LRIGLRRWFLSPFGQRGATRSLGAFVLVVVSIACSSNPPIHHQASVDQSSPSSVAIAYVTALFEGNVNKANSFVSPVYRNILPVVNAGQSPAVGQTRNIAVGSSTVNGDSAFVVLTGTLCGPRPQAAQPSAASPATNADSGGTPSPGPPAPAPPAPSQHMARRCFTNTDPHSSNPAFRVELVRSQDGGNWFVTFPYPASSPTPSGS
jgi:hypothetical protein